MRREMYYYVKPWSHQLEAIEFANKNKDVALFWEMGTGKTATTINILRQRYRKKERVMSTFILAPIVVLENWRNEFCTHAGMDPKQVKILKGTGKKKIEQLKKIKRDDPYSIVVANYEVMQNKDLVNELLSWQPEVLVCDESQRLKSHKSKRAQAVAKIAKACKHRYLLSGTPVLNSPMDIFMQFKILDGGETFGDKFFYFQKKYFYDKNAGMPKHVHFPDWQPKPGIYDMFNKMISAKALRARKEDCLDLPPLVKENLYVDLSSEQRRAYKEMRDDFVTFIKDKDKSDEPQAVVAQLAITKGLRLQQIVSGFVKTDDGDVVRFDKSPRIKELKTLLEDLTPESKVIVWACFIENYKQIAEVCEELGLGYAQLIGGIKDREGEMNKFRGADECRVMIANPQSAGLGVNLVEAKYSIYFSKNFSLENDLQSEARNHRGGSEKLHDKITRIDLVAKGTLDEEVTRALAQKVNIAEKILDWDI